MSDRYIPSTILHELKSHELEDRDRAMVEVAPEVERPTGASLTLAEHFRLIRDTIQDVVEPVPELIPDKVTEDTPEVKELRELLTPELSAEHGKILRTLVRKTQVSDQHVTREIVDIEASATIDILEHWINGVLANVADRRPDWSAADREELEATCWMYFDALGVTLNTRSVEEDVRQFKTDRHFETTDGKDRTALRQELQSTVQERYQLSEVDAAAMVDLVEAQDKGKPYNLRVLIDTCARLWKDYDLDSQKGQLGKISLGYLIGKSAESFAPYVMKDLYKEGGFNFAAFAEFWGLNWSSEIIQAKAGIELEKVLQDIGQRINERIVNSLFYEQFEFVHERSLGEVYTKLQRGKNAVKGMVGEVTGRFIPTLAGTGMSIGFLTKINPVLGGVGLAGLPIMYHIARRQNEAQRRMQDRLEKQDEAIMGSLDKAIHGIEEIRTSAEAPTIAGEVQSTMDESERLSYTWNVESTKRMMARMIPYNVTSLAAGGIGTLLQRMGKIEPGAVFSNIIYTNQLNRPLQELVRIYFDDLSRYVQDIDRMNGILSDIESQDLPDGEREQGRTAVSSLPNVDISLHGVGYKDILRDVDIDVHQGEFVTIAGPSGAGKSTLLRTLVGLYKPTQGTITMGGTPVDDIKRYGADSLYGAMSYANQRPQYFEDMTLRQNLLLWARESVDDGQINTTLKELHLDHLVARLDEKMSNASGGELVRIGVARTLLKKPRIMLLDEPTSSLDSQSADEVRRVIQELRVKHPTTTIICVSHDPTLIAMGERTIEIQKGTGITAAEQQPLETVSV